MARAKGRDLVIEVFDAVEKLQTVTARHTELLGDMAAHAASVSAQVTALSEHFGALSQHVGALSQNVGALSQNVGALSQHVDALSQNVGALSQHASFTSQRLTTLEAEFQRSAENAKRSFELGRSTQKSIAELARVLRDFAGTTADRFAEIEDRLTSLEREAS